MCPFDHPEEGYVDAERIRSSLGDFSKLLKTPSKYAARIAQAFTATEASVELEEGQWEAMPDIEKTDPETGLISCHTDGVGTISPELGDMIWEARCASDHFSTTRCKPSAVCTTRIHTPVLSDGSPVPDSFPWL